MRSLLPFPLLLLTATASAGSPPPPAALQGFDLQWEKRPHRLNVLGLGVQPTEAGDALWTEVRGGTWADGTMATDSTDTRVHYVRLEGSERPALRGSEPFEIRGAWSRQADQRLMAVATHPVQVELPVEAEAAAVWLSGLRVSAGPEHPPGYTMQGLTVTASAPVVEGRTARFEVTVSVVAGAVPWRDQDLDDYSAAVRVDWLLVPAAASEVHRVEAPVEMHRRRRFFAEPDPPTTTALAWDLPEGAAGAMAGCSGFSFLVEGRGALDGRFLRALTVDLQAEAVAKGRWQAEAAVRFSNAGELTRPMHTSAASAWTVLALRGDERAVTGAETLRGTATKPLP